MNLLQSIRNLFAGKATRPAPVLNCSPPAPPLGEYPCGCCAPPFSVSIDSIKAEQPPPAAAVFIGEMRPYITEGDTKIEFDCVTSALAYKHLADWQITTLRMVLSAAGQSIAEAEKIAFDIRARVVGNRREFDGSDMGRMIVATVRDCNAMLGDEEVEG